MKSLGSLPFRIGPWRVEPALDEISRDGTTIKLEPRTMRVLVCLAEHAGEVVSVDRLLESAWKDLVVTQHSAYQAVAVLRRALADDPKAPRYIANVPRRGYRLVAPVAIDGARDAAPPPVGSLGDASPPEEPAPADDPVQPPVPVLSEGPVSGHRVARRYGWALIAVLVLAGSVGWFLSRPWRENPAGGPPALHHAMNNRVEAENAAFTPPPHSVAVLPFTNLSGDPKQEYFSDGMTEEMINALAQIDALKVIARTSSFSFKGKDTDIRTIARELNVAAVLEGSVRRSGNQVRVTAQLIDAVNGFHLWSRDYDRDLNNILGLQTAIATAVAQELKAKLLAQDVSKIELGGTRDSAAFDAYLRGSKAYVSEQSAEEAQASIAAYTEAIRLDPHYALAFAGRSHAWSSYAEEYATGAAIREGLDKAHADAHQAIALAPELAEGYAALGHLLDSALDFRQANDAYERALSLAPGNVQVLRVSADFAIAMGRFDAGLAAAHRAVTLDPLNPRSYYLLGQALYAARQYDQAIAAYTEAIRLDPKYQETYGVRGLAYYGLGNLQSALASCETKPDYWVSQWCLALVYDKLGRHGDAAAVLAKYQAAVGDAAAYQFATIYAQWGDRATALRWLDKAMHLRDSGLVYLKTDPLLDPLRSEPRFQAIEQELNFPT